MKYKVLLLGLGRIGSTLEKDPLRNHPCTHAGMILNSELSKNFDLSGIYDENKEKISEFLIDWNLKSKKISTSWDEILKKKFDLCVIASSSVAHFKNAEFALNHGIKQILIEKPICTEEKDLKKMVDLARKRKAKIWVNHERRYHPLYQYIQKQLELGSLGALKTIRASVLTSGLSPGIAFQELGGGPLLHDGTHAIDYLDFLLGNPKKIHFVKMHRPKTQVTESRALALLEYDEDVFVFLEAGGERNYFQFEIDIQTSSHRIVLSNDGHKIYKTKESPLYKGFKSLQEIELPKFSNNNPWIHLYSEILEHLKGKGTKILGDLESNVRIFQTLKMISQKKL
jgi:predicted dehydrogenase